MDLVEDHNWQSPSLGSLASSGQREPEDKMVLRYSEPEAMGRACEWKIHAIECRLEKSKHA